MDEQDQPNRSRPPAEFRRYLLDEHQRFANAQQGPGEQFTGMGLHAANPEGWEGIAHAFTKRFEKFLDAGIREVQQTQEHAERAHRYVRVEGAILWLEQADGKLGIVLRHFQQPPYVRAQGNAWLAEQMGMSEDTAVFRLRDRAIRRVWWRLGGTW